MVKSTPTIWSLVLLLNCFVIFAQEIKRVRINFHSPDNLNRELLLGFTPNNEASDGFDYGYDGASADSWPNDLNWIINDNLYIIQGVGTFDVTKTYPLWLGLSNYGTSSISLISTENFDEEIAVYIYDSNDNSYHEISEQPLDLNLEPNVYSDRFFIAFEIPQEFNDSLSNSEFTAKPRVELFFSATNNNLKIQSQAGTEINNIKVINVIGQPLFSSSQIQHTEINLDLRYYKSQVLLIEIDTNKGRLIKRIVI